MGFHTVRAPRTPRPYDPLLEPRTNTQGAILFLTYILAALLLTALLARDLVNAFIHLPPSLRNRPKLSRNLQVFTGLAILSFSILSYHMLDYLLFSYEAWAQQRKLTLPQRIYGLGGLFGPKDQRAPVHLWVWACSSTLFQDFAKAISAPYQHAWWASQALFVTMGWNVIFSIEGPHRRIPNLWAYVMVSQVLPVSFAQNLFFLATLLRGPPKKDLKVFTPGAVELTGPLLGFAMLVLVSPRKAGQRGFMLVIGAIRALLAWPMLAQWALPDIAGKYLTVEEARVKKQKMLVVLAVCMVAMTASQTMSVFTTGGGLGDIVQAVNSHPAVSALGYDYLLSMLSAAAWHLLVDADAPEIPEEKEAKA